ncbi:MAG: glycosyltransferase family 2 protein [Nitrospirae bacterium]|nr:glycosyltransferase family 2 protein [Nitrospirota bacterium]
MKNKRFSVLIPVYNRDVYVRECIDSIFSQTFKDYEIIAIDDGSTDGTLEVLQSYGEQIKVLSQANQGPEVARNLGASQASGEYLVFLDSDDFMLSWTLATYDRIIQECDFPTLIIGTLLPFHDGQDVKAAVGSNTVIELLKYRDYLSKDTSTDLSCSNIVIKSSVFKQAGGHRQSTPKTFHADEHDFVLRVGTYGPCVILQKPATVAYRIHGDNTIRDVARMVSGVLSLVHAEQQGYYPGGQQRRFARYAVIGGMAYSWLRQALHARSYVLALKLLMPGSIMLIVGALNKLSRLFRRRTPSIILTEQQAD